MGALDVVKSLVEGLNKIGVQKSMIHLISQHGVEFKPAARDHSIQLGKRGLCFMNAMHLSISHRLIYTEGYVLIHGVPLHHAWCVQDGTVIDPTIEDQEKWEYVGIPMQADYVLDVALKTDVYGVLDNMKNHEVYDLDAVDFVHPDYMKV